MSRYPPIPLLLLLTACVWFLTTPVHANVNAEEQPQRFPQTTPGPPPDLTADVPAMKKVFAETERKPLGLQPEAISQGNSGVQSSPFANNPRFKPVTKPPTFSHPRAVFDTDQTPNTSPSLRSDTRLDFATPPGDPEVTAPALSSGAPSGMEMTSHVPNETIKRDAEHGKLLGATPQEQQTAEDALARGDFAGVRALAEQGNPGAQYMTGQMYLIGEGVPQDYQEALKWFRLAAEQGDAVAQYTTGVMLHKGKGAPQDYQEALKWFRLAAKQSFAASQTVLGKLYFRGKGVPQNYAEAAKWFRLAAEQGDFGGQRGLGLMYEKGHGVTEDYVQAHAWYNLAAAQNNNNGMSAMLVAQSRDRVGEKMTREQIAEAQRLAGEWQAQHQK